MTASIVIPTYNGLPLLMQCVESIRRYTSPVPYEIIVVDNGSSDETIGWCRAEGIDFVSLPVNRGFPVACNYGLQAASGDTLVLLNNDTVVSHRWLVNLQACLHSSQKIGIVGPMTNYVSGAQQSDLAYDTLDQFHDLANRLNRHDPSLWRRTDRIVGLCMVFRRQLMERIGLLDERYSPGHYEDDDYCYRAKLAGYELSIAGDTHIHHVGSASFKQTDAEELSKLVERNHQIFMDKWGFDPQIFI